MIKKTLILHLLILVCSAAYPQHGPALRSSWAKSYAHIDIAFLNKPVSANEVAKHSYTYSPSALWGLEMLYKFKKGFTLNIGTDFQKHALSVTHYDNYAGMIPSRPILTIWNIEQVTIKAGVGYDWAAFENMRIFCRASYLYYSTLKESESSLYEDDSRLISTYFEHNGLRHGFSAGMGIAAQLDNRLGITSGIDFLSTPGFVQYRHEGAIHTAALTGIMFNLGIEFRMFTKKKDE